MQHIFFLLMEISADENLYKGVIQLSTLLDMNIPIVLFNLLGSKKEWRLEDEDLGCVWTVATVHHARVMGGIVDRHTRLTATPV